MFCPLTQKDSCRKDCRLLMNMVVVDGDSEVYTVCGIAAIASKPIDGFIFSPCSISENMYKEDECK